MTRPRAARRRAPVLGLLALLLAVRAPAAPRLYLVDPEHSQIRFHAVSRFMDADGSFRRFGGELWLDEARPETVSARLTIEVASLDTGIELRDRHLRSDDFFDVERHPQATFVTSAVRREGERFIVSGDLAIRGVARAIVVPVTVTGGEGAIRIVGEFVLNRQEFGVAYRSWLNPIRDDVRVWFDLTVRAR